MQMTWVVLQIHWGGDKGLKLYGSQKVDIQECVDSYVGFTHWRRKCLAVVGNDICKAGTGKGINNTCCTVQLQLGGHTLTMLH